jgi:Protein of unknown function (DUF3667)
VIPAEKPEVTIGSASCGSCGTVLVGRFCHDCGQERIGGRLTTREFTEKFARYMMKFDKSFVGTLWRAVRSPGKLARDYLAGRRSGILDPIRYFLSTVFLQLVIAAIAQVLASAIDRPAFADTLGAVGHLVAIKFAVIILSAAVWRALSRRDQFTTAEVAVFAIYSFATLGLLWAVLPLLEVLLGLPLSSYRIETIVVVMLIAAVYLTFGIREFARTSLPGAAMSAVVAMGLAYGLVAAVVGIARSIEFVGPLLGAH